MDKRLKLFKMNNLIKASFVVFLLLGIYTATCVAVQNIKISSILEDRTDLQQQLSQSKVNLIFDDDTVSLSKSDLIDFEYSYKLPNLLTAVFKDIEVVKNISWNMEKISNQLDSIYKEPTDAELLFDEVGGWELVPDEYSRSFDKESIAEIIAAHDYMEPVDIEIHSYMVLPETREVDLVEEYSRLFPYNDFVIEYSDGFRVTGPQLMAMLDEPSGDLSEVNLSFIKDQLTAKYQTTDKVVGFTTTAGDNIQVQYKTYGISVLWVKEEKALRELIANHESSTNRKLPLGGYDDLSNTYIEVSINDQHLWHYTEGELCCETDIVTGTKGRHDTPTGLYYISECIPGKYLTGDDYKTWVNQWMRLTNSGVGLHDAYWRGAFGGNIYVTDGSHGCINLPKDFARNLFSEVKNGYAVIVY